MDSVLRLVILSTLVVLSWEQRRAGLSRSIGPLSSGLRPTSDLPNSSGSTQEADYVYEYYDEPTDYQHYPPRPQIHRPESLQGRRVQGQVAAVPPTVARPNVLDTRRPSVPTGSTKRPNLQAQLARFIPSLNGGERSSTESTATADEYEYLYEDSDPETPSKEIETKVSVSVSASKQTSTSTPAPPKPVSPESGIVISVATTRSVSSRLNPTPPTTPTTPTGQGFESVSNVTGEVLVEQKVEVTSRQAPPVSSTTSIPDLGIKFEDVSRFLPADYKKPPVQSLLPKIQFQEVLSQDFLPKDYVLSTVATPPSVSNVPSTTPSTTTTSTTTPATTTTTSPTPSTTPAASPSPSVALDPLQALMNKLKFAEDISALLPPGFKDKSLLPPDYKPDSALLPPGFKEKSLFPLDYKPDSALLPPGFKEKSLLPLDYKPDFAFLPPGFKEKSLLPLDYKPDFSLLPPGFKEKSLLPPDYNPEPTNETSSTTVAPPTVSPGKLVFPTRAGGTKAIRPTTPEPAKGETPAPPKVALKSGWPTRKTTEFTGWPTVSTTPRPSTTTPSTTTTPQPSTELTTTTERTTTTESPPKRNPETLCEPSVCKMEATLRLTGGIRWKPEYADINTEEWKHLENTVKRELDGAYRSSGLAPFYRSIEIEAFNEGSVVVDYFLLLDNVDRVVSSDQIRSLFHAALLQADEPFENRLRLGRYSIDPRYTDFKARTFESESVTGDLEEALIPQWGIAVIVIGLASLLFVIIFALTLMFSKRRKGSGGKKSGVSLTQEMLNEFNKRSLGSGDSSVVRREDLYNMDDAWEESQLERTLDQRSNRRSSLDAKDSYNIYDSWKTEWNGYNHQFRGDSGSRRRADYDTNF